MRGEGGVGVDVEIAYGPERVLPGRILVELIKNERCIGGITPRCARKALTFYRQFVRGECVTTNARAAEMTKLVENSYRDVNIAFANELSVIADGLDLDVWEVIRLANRHPRVNILRSEEHTSELQSLMRISYAVFCLKKKKKNKRNNQPTTMNKETTKIRTLSRSESTMT